MAVEYPYALGVTRIPTLFDKIARVGKPSKVDTNWLKSVGFMSGSDGRLLTILRFLNFVDSSKAPTDLWQEYRGPNGKKTLATAIRRSYVELFHTYPNAHQASVEDLSNFVRSNTDLAAETFSRVVGTFRALVALADFSDVVTSENGQRDNGQGDDGDNGETDPDSERHSFTDRSRYGLRRSDQRESATVST